MFERLKLFLRGKKDWEYFSSCVVGFDEVFMNRWLPMMSANLFIIYYGFRLWAVFRRSVTSLYILGIVDFVFLIGYVFYVALFLILPLKNMSTLNFMPKGFLIIEQVIFNLSPIMSLVRYCKYLF